MPAHAFEVLSRARNEIEVCHTAEATASTQRLTLEARDKLKEQKKPAHRRSWPETHDVVIVGGGPPERGGEPAQAAAGPRYFGGRAANKALLPTRLDNGRGRHFPGSQH